MKKLILMTEVMDRLGIGLLKVRELITNGSLTPVDVTRFGVRVARFDADEVEAIRERLTIDRAQEVVARCKALSDSENQPSLFTLPAQ